MEIKIKLDDIMSSCMIRMLETEIKNQTEWIKEDEEFGIPKFVMSGRKEIIEKCKQMIDNIKKQRIIQRKKEQRNGKDK